MPPRAERRSPVRPDSAPRGTSAASDSGVSIRLESTQLPSTRRQGTPAAAPTPPPARRSSSATGVPSSISYTPGPVTAPLSETRMDPGSSVVPSSRNHSGPKRAIRARCASVSAFCTSVGAPPTPRSKGRGGVNVGFAGPPFRKRTSAVSSPATNPRGAATVTSSTLRSTRRLARASIPSASARRSSRRHRGPRSPAAHRARRLRERHRRERGAERTERASGPAARRLPLRGVDDDDRPAALGRNGRQLAARREAASTATTQAAPLDQVDQFRPARAARLRTRRDGVGARPVAPPARRLRAVAGARRAAAHGCSATALLTAPPLGSGWSCGSSRRPCRRRCRA